MFNNSSHIDASHSTFSEVHRDQHYNARPTVQGNQTINTIVHGNQILQDSHSNHIEALQKASAPSAAHDSAQRYPAPKCIEGTRIELLARISSWADEPDQKPICWLNGRPGLGKSAVSQTIAEKYASQKRLAASFFFSRRDLERRTTQHVVPTLTTQLLSFLPSIRPAVIAALENDYMIPMKVLREQMEKLLLDTLSTATETLDAPVLIVVDALDECDDESLVSELITLLALLPRKTSLPLRLLITSRPEPWIESHIHQPDISALTLPLEIHTFSAEADIRSFLRHALDDTYDQHLQVMIDVPRPWPSLDGLERIVNKTGGLFIFAFTVVKFVGAKTHNPALRLQAILEDTASESAGSAYADLDSLYRDAISTFPDPDVARLVLGLVYCMTIPMTVSGLHKLLQRPDVDVRLVVPTLNSVLLASEDGTQPIQFYHASFRDFLINPHRSQKYTINPDVYHRLMAQLCFETMSNSLKRDMCGIGNPARANSEVPDLAERRETAFDEALLYACCYWSRHLAQLPNDGVSNEALLSALNRFSTTVLLCWVEALSIFGKLESAVVMLREGIRWLQTLREVPGDTIKLFQSAERFVLFYMDPISQCALHAYVTAISFIPKDGVIYKTFKHQSLGTLLMQPPLSGYLANLRRDISLHNPIHSVVFSPNCGLIATAGAKQGVQVWSAITGGNVASLGDHSSTSLFVRFSPSGAFLAAAFEGGTVTVWDPKVGREHMKHESCHTETITCIEFSTDSALLASGSRDHAIQVWSVETAKPLYRLASHEGPVTSLAFSCDSLRLFSGSEDNLIISWDVSTGKLVRGMMGHRKPVNCIAVSKDQSILASGSEDKTIKIWDTSSGKCTRTLSKGHHTGIRSVHFFDEDKRVVAACDGAIISWAVTSRTASETIWAVEQFLKTTAQRVPSWQTKVLGWGAPTSVFRYMSHHIFDGTCPEHISIAYAHQSPSFVFAHMGYLHSGSLPTPTNNPPLRNKSTVTTVSISSDGLWAATGDPLGSLEIIDLTAKGRTWEELERSAKSDPLSHVGEIVPSPNGGRFILRCIFQWYLIDADYQIIKKILDIGVMESIRDSDDVKFKFSADGSIYFCVVPNFFNDNKSTIRVSDSVTGEHRAQFTGLKNVHSFVASADGAWIACGRGLGQVDVFQVASKERTNIGESNGSPIKVLVFSDEAQEIVGGSETGVVRVWDRASGECKATFGASTSMVTALAYAAGTPATADGGGARIAIGREDGSLCVWSPSTSASHDLVRGDQATVKHVDFVRFSDDQTRLTSRGEDGTAFSWAISFDADDTDMARCTRRTRQEGVDAHNTSLPHLLSRSDPEDTVDSLFHTAYRVRKDGWLVEGDRRVIWLPPFTRPHGKNTFYAYENGSVALCTPSSTWLFLRYVK
ncbi:hypothetical protein J3R82DRAFT_6749 [Butyriboletus roseoflavus]|nr:hypothetical protein J3R82DRAFT_6749 [Butyriboletus roseoflavus]